MQVLWSCGVDDFAGKSGMCCCLRIGGVWYVLWMVEACVGSVVSTADFWV